MKRLASILCMVLLIVVPASAAAFSDDFDSKAFTDTSWDKLLDTWDHVVLTGLDLGYHGTNNVPGNPAAASFADNQQYFRQANLSVETLLRLDGNEADKENAGAGFIFVSGSVPQSNYVEYTVLIEIDYDDDPINPDRKLNVWSNSITPSGTTEILVGTLAVNITFDRFYSLQVSTDAQGNIDVLLYEASSNTYLGGLSGVSLSTRYESGMVGIGTIDEATFNNFSLTGTAIPIYGRAIQGPMMLLLNTE